MTVGCASEDNEENTSECSHDPSSLRSTLESNPDLASQMESLGAQEIELRPGGKYHMCEVRECAHGSLPGWHNTQKPLDYAASSESDSDEGSNVTIATQIPQQSPTRARTPATTSSAWQ